MSENSKEILCDECNVSLERDTTAEETVLVCPKCKNRCVLVNEKLNKSLIANFRPIGTFLFSCLNCRLIYVNELDRCSHCGFTSFSKSELRLV